MGDEAEAQLAHLSGGHHVPDYGSAPDFDSQTVGDAFSAMDDDGEMDAAEIAARLTVTVGEVLARSGHLACELEGFAATTLHEGTTVVVCGCGQFFDAPELATTAVVLAPDRVDAHSTTAVTVAAADPIARTLALLGPTEDYAPEQVERLMLDTLRRIEEGQAFERWTMEQAAAASTAYEREYAKQFVLASGPMELRRYAAVDACEDLMVKRDETAMVYRAAKAAMHNLRSVLSGYQSVLRSVQATYTAGGTSGRPF